MELTYLSLEHIESNTGKILKDPVGRMEDEGISTSFGFDSRHVLYGKLRPYLNKVALPDFRGRCTTEIIPLLPSPGVDRDFLCRVLRRSETVEAAMQGKTGSRMPRANMDELLTLEIPLPPLPEQKRIASILNEQMSAVEKARLAAEAQLEAAKALPAAYLRQVFPQPGQALPTGWNWVKVGEVCDNIDYGYTESADFSIKEPKFLRITDIQNGRVDWGAVPGCRITPDDEMSNRLSDGDIVFTRTGATTGKSFIIKSPPRAVFASYLIRLKSSNRTDPNYLSLFFQSDDYWRQIRANARGGAQPNVNATLLSRLDLPLPSLPEQKRIAVLLSNQMLSVDKLRAGLEFQLSEINALLPALLRKAFNGEL